MGIAAVGKADATYPRKRVDASRAVSLSFTGRDGNGFDTRVSSLGVQRLQVDR